jgi:hypothetical protein
MRFVCLAVVVAAAALLPSSPASAHKGNPNYLSVINAVEPEGLKVSVVNRDDRLLFENTTNEDVIIEGYEGEPYVRLAADGTVAVNRNSKAYYLNRERFQTEGAPASLTPETPPEWEEVSKTGRYEFHDHRTHWMGKGTPEAVSDEGTRTKIFDWSVPVRVGGSKGAVTGTLFWTPAANAGGVPIGAIIVGALIVIGLSIAVVVVRRRRAAAGASPEGGGEAW